jgi:hypothetical protein
VGFDLHRRNPLGVQEKKSATFLAGLSTGKSTGRIELPVEKMREGGWPGLYRTGASGCPQARGNRGAGGQRYGWPTARNSPSPAPGAGYHSPVRSNTRDEIGRIASAIDQLESDARNTADQAELTTRIAMLWQMVSALDPELARRAQLYTEPPGGTPSA